MDTGRMTRGQDENSAPMRPKKKSALPVPVRKVAQQRHRPVLGSVQNPAPIRDHSLSKPDVRHKPVQQKPATNLTLGDRGVPKDKSFNSKPSVLSGMNKTPSLAASKNVHQRAPKSVATSNQAAMLSTGKGLDKAMDGLMSLIDEQKQCGVDFQTDSKAYRSIITNTGITMATSGTVSEMFKPKRVTEGQGKPMYTPKMMRHSVYNKVSLMDSCKQYQKFLKQGRGLQEESASPKLMQTHPEVTSSNSLVVKEAPSLSANKNLPQRMQKPAAAFPKESLATEKKLRKPQDVSTLSMVEEQEQSGIDFQVDNKAYKSIITNTGITMAASGTVSEKMFRPQRVTEGQGKPMYTPLRMRNSVYCKEPRMSLMDSCKQYRNFLRQERGIEEESASPVLPKPQPRVAIIESPLVKGMKSERVVGSVYPKYTVQSLTRPSSSCNEGLSDETGDKKDATTPKNRTNDALRTPRTPLMTFGRVPQTETPSSLTPARRVPMHGSKYSDQRSKSQLHSQAGMTAKKLRWADILGACSPDPPSAPPAQSQGNTSQEITPSAAPIKTTLQLDDKPTTTTTTTCAATIITSTIFTETATRSGSLLSLPVAASDLLPRGSDRSNGGVARPAATPQDWTAGQYHSPHHHQQQHYASQQQSPFPPTASLPPTPPLPHHQPSSLNTADAASSSSHVKEKVENGEDDDGGNSSRGRRDCGCGFSNRSSTSDSSASLSLTHNNKATWSAAAAAASLGQTRDTTACGGSSSNGNGGSSLSRSYSGTTARHNLRSDDHGFGVETESAAPASSTTTTGSSTTTTGPPSASDAVGALTGRCQILRASSDAALLQRLRGELTTSRQREDFHRYHLHEGTERWSSRHRQGDGGDNVDSYSAGGRRDGDHYRCYDADFSSARKKGGSDGEVAPARDQARAPVSLVTSSGVASESSLARPAVATGGSRVQQRPNVGHTGGVSSSLSVQDIFARLQILEGKERAVQHEMQLLRMAMHTEQEGDSNGNHHGTASDASSAASTTNTTTTTSNSNHHTHTNTIPTPNNVGLSDSGSGSHQHRQRGVLPQCIQMAPFQTSQPPPASTHLIPYVHATDPAVPFSGLLSNDAFCGTTTTPSSPPQPDSSYYYYYSPAPSSSPDINSNIIAMEKTGREGQSGDSVTVPALTLGTGDAPALTGSSGWPSGGADSSTTMAAPEKINLFLVSDAGTLRSSSSGGHDDGDRAVVVTTTKEEDANSSSISVSAEQLRENEQEEEGSEKDVAVTSSLSLSSTAAVRRSAFEGFSPRNTSERGGHSLRSGVDRGGCGGRSAEIAEVAESSALCYTNIGLGFGLSPSLMSGTSSSDSGHDVVGTSLVIASQPLPGLQKKKLHERDVTLRQSVDMEVEDDSSASDGTDDNDENVSNVNITSNIESHSPFVPQTPGLAGRDPVLFSSSSSTAAAAGLPPKQPFTVINSSTAKMNPVSVIVRPRVNLALLTPSSERKEGEEEEEMEGSTPISPPIWTTLALQSAATNNMINSLASSASSDQALSLATSSTSRNATTITTARDQAQPSPASSSCKEADHVAVAASARRGLSLPPRVKQRNSPPKRSGTRSIVSPTLGGSSSSTFSSHSSAPRRSPLRSTLRQGQGPHILGAALKNPDVFLEALLEDECALYAGRLQSFFKEASCDRQELPDPVARILSEGDELHFLPVRDGSAYPRPVLEGSAFGCFVPV